MKFPLLCFVVLLLGSAAVVSAFELPTEPWVFDKTQKPDRVPSHLYAFVCFIVPLLCYRSTDALINPFELPLHASTSDNGTVAKPAKNLGARHATANSISYTLDSNWTNETLSGNLCGDLTSFTSSGTVELMASAALRFLLPDCFYGSAHFVETIHFGFMIVQGNSSFREPLERLALAISQTPTRFVLESCYLLTETGLSAQIDWNSLSTITSSVTELNFANTFLGFAATIPTFPRPIPTLVLSNSGLSGPLPDTLFASSLPAPTAFYFTAEGNGLTGVMPRNLFANLNLSSLLSFEFLINGNTLTGPISPLLLGGSFSVCKRVVIDLSSNGLNGPIGSIFAATTFSAQSLETFSFSGNSNSFIGPTPTWLNSMEVLTDFKFACIDCSLTSLSTSFFASSTVKCTYVVDLTRNQLSGDIPSTFFQFGVSPDQLTLSLPFNAITGLPSLGSANFSASTSIFFDLQNNKLTGNLPASPGLVSETLASYRFYISHNPTLTGTVPASFLASFATATPPSSLYLNLYLVNTSLTGTLALPNFSTASGIKLTLDANLANFLSLTSPSAASSGLVYLRLNNNPLLSGALSASLFQNNLDLNLMSASNTRLNGNMPDMGSINPPMLATLNLASTLIDFCSESRSTWTSAVLASCNLTSTTAYYCNATYPTKCSTSAPPPPPPPTTPPIEVPSGCPQSTRPSPSFTCIDGTWTFIGSVESTVINIPSGASTTTIKGNLTSATVIISGLNSVLVVDGCTSNVTIIIELTPDQLKTIGSDGKLQQLLSYSNNSSCNSSLSDTTIATKINGSSCQKVSVSKESSSDGTVSGLFKIDKNGCSNWWIILVSVIAAIVVLVVVLVLLALFVPPIRECVRPYSKQRRQGAQIS